MRHSLKAHLVYLENRIQDASNRLARPDLTIDEIQDLELQLTLAQSALTHYRKAYELELNVSGSEPPDQPGSKSGGGGEKGDAKNSNPPKKKESLAGIGVRAKRTVRRRSPMTFKVGRPNGATSGVAS